MSWVSLEQTLQNGAGADQSGQEGMQRQQRITAAAAAAVAVMMTFPPVKLSWCNLNGTNTSPPNRCKEANSVNPQDGRAEETVHLGVLEGNAQTKGARGQRHFERLRLNLLLSEIGATLRLRLP